MNEAKIGFELRTIQVPVGDILPVRQLKDPDKTVRRYKAIAVSVKEVGLIEPLMVYPQKDAPGKYLLLDGHLRLFALKELGYVRRLLDDPEVTKFLGIHYPDIHSEFAAFAATESL
jgi:ParB-like chromosome segregation protein Spo0J